MIWLGLFLIGYAALSFFARDFLWELTHFHNDLEGRASERSDIWDMGTIISGVVAAGIGLFLLLST